MKVCFKRSSCSLFELRELRMGSLALRFLSVTLNLERLITLFLRYFIIIYIHIFPC
jgi:hypothetical protein